MKLFALVLVMAACGGDAMGNGNKPFSEAVNPTRRLGLQDAKYDVPFGKFLPEPVWNFNPQSTTVQIARSAPNQRIVLTRMRNLNMDADFKSLIATPGNDSAGARIAVWMGIYEASDSGDTMVLRLLPETYKKVLATSFAGPSTTSNVALYTPDKPFRLLKDRRYFFAFASYPVLTDYGVGHTVRTADADIGVTWALHSRSTFDTIGGNGVFPDAIDVSFDTLLGPPASAQFYVWQAAIPVDASDVAGSVTAGTTKFIE